MKLELLTEFPASNDEKYYYLWKTILSKLSDICIDLKHLNPVYIRA